MKTLAEHYADCNIAEYWQENGLETLSRALERWYEERRETRAFLSHEDELKLDSLWEQRS